MMSAIALHPLSEKLRKRVLPETVLICGLCFLDMAWTMAAVRLGIAKESNPIMAPLLVHGMIYFAVVKMLSFLVPLGILEMVHERNPRFIVGGLRFLFTAYIGLYIVGTLHVHGVLHAVGL